MTNDFLDLFFHGMFCGWLVGFAFACGLYQHRIIRTYLKFKYRFPRLSFYLIAIIVFGIVFGIAIEFYAITTIGFMYMAYTFTSSDYVKNQMEGKIKNK